MAKKGALALVEQVQGMLDILMCNMSKWDPEQSDILGSLEMLLLACVLDKNTKIIRDSAKNTFYLGNMYSHKTNVIKV